MNITKEQVNVIINYLARRPYMEVYKLIDMLSNLQKEVKKK